MRQRKPAIGFSLAALAALFFVINAGVSSVALRAHVRPETLTTVRVTGTALALLGYCLLFRRSALALPRGRDALLLVGLGVVGVAALQWAYFVAIDRLPVGMALLLEYQAPILVALWARFVQREPVRPRLWAGLALAWLGLAAATGIWNGVAFDSTGMVAGLLAAVCFAAYFLIGEAGVSSTDPLRVVLWSFVVASVVMNLVHPVTELPASRLRYSADLLGSLSGGHAPVWLVLAWVVLLGTLLPFAAELAAMQHLKATTVTLVAMLEPIGVNALGWAWFGQSLGAVAVVGVFAVVAGVLLAQSARTTLVEPPTLT